MQADLSLRWSHKSYCRICHSLVHLSSCYSGPYYFDLTYFHNVPDCLVLRKSNRGIALLPFTLILLNKSSPSPYCFCTFSLIRTLSSGSWNSKHKFVASDMTISTNSIETYAVSSWKSLCEALPMNTHIYSQA